MSTEFENIAFDLPKNQSNVIKVIGVGGGGSNAVNHMYKKGINGVDFVVCNTDAQALQNSPVPTKIQLGASLTEGLGAGANPEIGEQAAMESINDIKAMLSTRAKMVFITVGMGGGTGTGAAPIIAKVAKELDLLTVGIVTIPFSFEGKMRNEQAQKGIQKLRQHIDSMVVINNNKLREVYGNLGFKAGFSKADEVLSTAASGIAEVITHHYTQNIDLKDAKTVLSNSGTAIMGSASATGPNRAQEAITKALDSPLLNDNKITGAKNVLLLIVSGRAEITIDEIGEINDYIQSEARSNVDIIMGVGEDEELGDAIFVTVIATGFNLDQQNEIVSTEAKKIVHDLDDKFEEPAKPSGQKQELVRHTLEIEEPEKEEEGPLTPTSENIKKMEVVYNEVNVEKLDDFVIRPVVKKEEISNEAKEKQTTLTFDLPLTSKVKVPVQETPQRIGDYEVIDPVFISSHQIVNGKVRFTLEEDEHKLDKIDKKETPAAEEDEELQFNVRIDNRAKSGSYIVEDEDDSPLNLTISELQERADDRRKKMKDFNYRFITRSSKNIEEIESKPAYKRMGVELDDVEHSSEPGQSKSRVTLGSDENNDIQLRSNNSFLHDNVD